MHKCWWVVTAVLIAVAGCTLAGSITVEEIQEIINKSKVSERNTLFERLLLRIIDAFRKLMSQGFNGVPPLDPLQIDAITLDDDVIPVPGSQIELVGVTLSHISTFVMDNLTVMTLSLLPPRLRIRFTVRIPELDLRADHYDLNLSAMGYDIFGAGSIKLKSGNPRLRVSMLFGLRIEGLGLYLNLQQTQINFNLDTFEPNITGLFNNDASSAFVSKVLAELVPTLLTHYKENITQFLSETVHEAANEAFADMNILALILPVLSAAEAGVL
ncbi:hypothetical protein ACJJTC_018293 [Scirpophaga incertulas]